MCGGGGDASEEARRQEEARKRQVEQATRAIEQAFSGRQSQLDDFVGALREEFRSEALRQKADVDRKTKFSLARGGLTGGSVDADTKVNIGEEFTRGILKGERNAQSALGDLLAADAATKQQLIALAQGGADATTAARSAAEALRSNFQGAQARGLSQGLGDIFSDTRDVYTAQQEAAARRRGLKDSDLFADPFSRG